MTKGLPLVKEISSHKPYGSCCCSADTRCHDSTLADLAATQQLWRTTLKASHHPKSKPQEILALPVVVAQDSFPAVLCRPQSGPHTVQHADAKTRKQKC